MEKDKNLRVRRKLRIIHTFNSPSIDPHLDPVVMFAVSASGIVAALSPVRTAVTANQNAAERVCEIGVLFGVGHGGHELGELRFNSGTELAGPRNDRLCAPFLV